MTTTPSPEHSDESALFVELGDGTIEALLPADLSSVSTARHFVHQRWAEVGDGSLDDVDLIVSELVANAIKHGEPDILFRVRADPFAIDIEVLDHGPSLPVVSTGEAGAGPGGRGLTIVERLASSWGVERLHGQTGKIVWASVNR